MKPEVILTVIEGKLTGQKFIFDERNTCIMGRNNDCYPQLPDDEFHRCISRYHCLLDINPPEIRIRDFGSKNGTFVNDQKIGQRADHETPEEGAKRNFPEYDLKDYDTINLSETVFQVNIKSSTGILPVNENQSNIAILPVNELLENENKTKETLDVRNLVIIKEESEENKQKKPQINLFNHVQNLLVKALKGNYVRKFTKGDSFYDILRNDPIPILKQNPHLPKKLAELIDLGLKEKPEIYFKNAQDLKEALLYRSFRTFRK